ncbi:MAG: TPM domain-containing protein [Bacteroidales bacterium]|nr:TPM domain-containing protein [Bacteroidales bacterium]
MKKYFLLIFAMVSMVVTAATVEEVPSFPMNGASKYVYNPDGIFSDGCVAKLNKAISEVWEKTTAELSVIAVDSVENTDPDSYADALLRKLETGKMESTPVFVLVVYNAKRGIIRAGMRADSIFTDSLKQQILRRDMFANFGQRRYDDGILFAVTHICEKLIESDLFRPQEPESEIAKQPWTFNTFEGVKIFFFAWVVFGVILLIVSCILIELRFWKASKNWKEELEGLSTWLCTASLLGLGIPSLAYIYKYVRMREHYDII